MSPQAINRTGGTYVRKFLKYAGLVFLGLVIAAIVGGVLVYQATRQEPEFYRRALVVDPEEEAEAGDELEQRVIDLRNSAQKPGEWEAEFTDAQVNGWLASDLPEKFPGSLPKEIKAPRLAFSPGKAQMACRYTGSGLDAVLALSVEMQLTGEPNELAIRITGADVGLFPLPLAPWKERISKAATRAELPLRWEEEDGDLVAVVTIPSTHEKFDNADLTVREIQLREGAIYLAGTTSIKKTGGSD